MPLSMKRWVGKVAIVTGASVGIGAAVAEYLVEEGIKVVGLARRKEIMDELAKKLENKKGKFYSIRCDVSKENEIIDAFKWVEENIGPVQILVNNAGILQDTNLIEGDTEKWKKLFDVNFWGLTIGCREGIKMMRKHNVEGHIINMNSIAGHKINYLPKFNMYTPAKYAMTALNETLRKELQFHKITNIKISNISPGVVRSEIFTHWTKKGEPGIPYDQVPTMECAQIAEAIIYMLATPPQIENITNSYRVFNMTLSMKRWVGKVAIVTGASVGIGAVVAEYLVEEGIKVVGLARRKEIMDELAKKLENKKGKFYSIRCDVSKENEIIDAFKWVEENIGPVQILVNNAGILQDTNLIEGDTEKWKKLFDVNFWGLTIGCREGIKMMRKHNVEGHIINMNSIAGHKINYMPKLSMYTPSKFAVTALNETLRKELQFHKITNIKISNISPGVVRSEIMKHWTKNGEPGIPYDKVPIMECPEIAEAIIYMLATPPHIEVKQLVIQPLHEDY